MRNAKPEARTYVFQSPKTDRKEWIGFATLVLPCLSFWMAVTAPPRLIADSLWIVSIAGLMLVAVLTA